MASLWVHIECCSFHHNDHGIIMVVMSTRSFGFHILNHHHDIINKALVFFSSFFKKGKQIKGKKHAGLLSCLRWIEIREKSVLMFTLLQLEQTSIYIESTNSGNTNALRCIFFSRFNIEDVSNNNNNNNNKWCYVLAFYYVRVVKKPAMRHDSWEDSINLIKWKGDTKKGLLLLWLFLFYSWNIPFWTPSFALSATGQIVSDNILKAQQNQIEFNIP